MKKILLSTVLCGGVLLNLANGAPVHATDVLNGNTEVGAEVIKGDVSLNVDNTTDFGVKSLDKTIDFGSKDINYTVRDYSGTTSGFTIDAKLIDTDSKRSLKVGEIELSDTAAPVVTKDTNVVGDNTDKISASLKYTGVETVKKYISSIEWSLTKGTTRQIAE